MTIYDRLGGLISNPVDRPFHTYKPRKRANLLRAEKVAGVQVSRLKGVRGIPLIVKQGGKKPRVRLMKDAIAIEYDGKGLVGRTLAIDFDQKRLASDPERYLNELARKYKITRESIELGGVSLRTGSASLGLAGLEGDTFADTVMGLMARYPRISNASPDRTPYNEWLIGVTITKLNGSKPKRKAKRTRRKAKAKRKANRRKKR